MADSDFSYYELHRDLATPSIFVELFAIPGLRMRSSAPRGPWVVRSAQPVTTVSDLQPSDVERWKASFEPRAHALQIGIAPSLLALGWRIEHRERWATIERMPLAPNRTGLQLEFSGNFGIAVALPLPSGPSQLRAMLRTPSEITLGIEPSFRSENGQILATLEPQNLTWTGLTTFAWRFPEGDVLDRMQVGELSLSLTPSAGSTRLFVDAIEFAP